MKLLHTADWHIGHRLHGFDRAHEHQAFLNWLIETIEERKIDGLLVCGDIFDTANPSSASWQLFYQFLATLRQRFPVLNVVIIGGNHDSPSKLDAPHELLKSFRLHLIGAIERDDTGHLNTEKLAIPLTDENGHIVAWCAAVPFLRSADLRGDPDSDDRLISGVREVYQTVYASIPKTETQPLIALGHAYLQNGELSALSERKVLGGNQHALPVSVFEGADYVALGHLHLAQQLNENTVYSGSPIPLSMNERNYPHQVVELAITNGQVQVTDRIPVPLTVQMLRIPEHVKPFETVLEQLNAFLPEVKPVDEQPFLEVRVLLDKPQPRLREQILTALKDKPVRLAKIHTEYTGHGLGVADQLQSTLEQLDATDVFRLCYQRQYQNEPDVALLQCFDALIHELENQE